METENWYNEGYLNIHGLIIFQNNSNRNLFAQREYHWKDRLSFIEEKDGTRLYVGSDSLSAFYKDIHNWNRITEEEFKLISGKSCYSEINMIRRDLKINQILEEE
jgi:hypothetical protein